MSDVRRLGYSGLPGQIAGTNVWPTEDAARAGRPAHVPAEKWTVTWTPCGRTDFGEIPLDQAFWTEQQQEASPPTTVV